MSLVICLHYVKGPGMITLKFWHKTAFPSKCLLISQIKRSLGCIEALLCLKSVIAAASLYRDKLNWITGSPHPVHLQFCKIHFHCLFRHGVWKMSQGTSALEVNLWLLKYAPLMELAVQNINTWINLHVFTQYMQWGRIVKEGKQLANFT